MGALFVRSTSSHKNNKYVPNVFSKTLVYAAMFAQWSSGLGILSQMESLSAKTRIGAINESSVRNCVILCETCLARGRVYIDAAVIFA